jgi:hypothetical protein
MENQRKLKNINEENAIIAFREILEKNIPSKILNTSIPDETNRKTKDIDYLLLTNKGRYAIEHTIVESFEKQLQYGIHSYSFVKKINTILNKDKIIPNKYYYVLLVPNELLENTSSDQRKQLQAIIANWIKTEIDVLKVDDFISQEVSNSRVTLICSGSYSELNGNVIRIQESPKDAEKLRKLRFQRGISDKLWKLLKYKLKRCRTVLILEDISGTAIKYAKKGSELTWLPRVLILLFVNIIIVMYSNRGKMIVGNIWKENFKWYSTIPQEKRFSLDLTRQK